jgi:hypothetical protein
MAYDIAKRRTTPRNWSRGGEQNIGTVGGIGGEGLSKKLVVGALIGAASMVGYLAWRGRGRGRWHPKHGYHTHPMTKTVFMTKSPTGRMVIG